MVEGLSLVGAGKVDNGGGTAPQRRPAAGVKVIGGGGAGHIQVKMGMSINEAGKSRQPVTSTTRASPPSSFRPT